MKTDQLILDRLSTIKEGRRSIGGEQEFLIIYGANNNPANPVVTRVIAADKVTAFLSYFGNDYNSAKAEFIEATGEEPNYKSLKAVLMDYEEGEYDIDIAIIPMNTIKTYKIEIPDTERSNLAIDVTSKAF